MIEDKDKEKEDIEFTEDNMDEDFELNAAKCLLTEDTENIRNVKKCRQVFDK